MRGAYQEGWRAQDFSHGTYFVTPGGCIIKGKIIARNYDSTGEAELLDTQRRATGYEGWLCLHNEQLEFDACCLCPYGTLRRGGPKLHMSISYYK